MNDEEDQSTAHCQWEDETVRERTGHSPSYAEAKKMKSLTLHTHGCLSTSLATDLLRHSFITKCQNQACIMFVFLLDYLMNIEY